MIECMMHVCYLREHQQFLKTLKQEPEDLRNSVSSSLRWLDETEQLL